MITRFERNLYFIITGKEPARIRRKPRRGPARDAAYLAWIRTLRCEACGRRAPSEAAHTGHDGGMSVKASDYSAIPLCHRCHRTGPYCYHGPNRQAFAAMYCLDFDAIVTRLNSIWKRLEERRQAWR